MITLLETNEMKDTLEERVLNGRYKLEKEFGRGSWGVVYKAKDLKLGGATVAVKIPHLSELARQMMKIRGIESADEAVIKEALGGFDSYSHVIPNYYDYDPNFMTADGETGLPFLVMPFKGKFLSEIIQDNGERKYLGRGLDLEEIIRWVEGIAIGAGELHEKNIVHCDIKPDNIAVEVVRDKFEDRTHYGEAKLADLGTKTFESIPVWPQVEEKGCRGPRGHEFIRAPEAFNDKYERRPSSDVFSIAAIGYRLFSGKYPLEEEILKGEDISKYNKDEFNSLMSKKCRRIKNKQLRKFFEKNLQYHPYMRASNGEHLLESFKETLRKKINGEIFRRIALIAGCWTIPFASILGFSGYLASTHEPQELRMPYQPLHGNKYRAVDKDTLIEFDYEKLELPFIQTGLTEDNTEFNSKRVTQNRHVAYLVKTHYQTWKHLNPPKKSDGLFKGVVLENVVNEHHWDIHIQYTTENNNRSLLHRPDDDYFQAWRMAIEQALNYSRNDHKVDLEDTMAISRVGLKKVMEAKRIARSEDWRDYSHARLSTGALVIPEDEQNFVNQWLSYFHNDID